MSFFCIFQETLIQSTVVNNSSICLWLSSIFRKWDKYRKKERKKRKKERKKNPWWGLGPIWFRKLLLEGVSAGGGGLGLSMENL